MVQPRIIFGFFRQTQKQRRLHQMKKLQPSQQLSKEIASLLESGIGEDQDLLSTLVNLSVRKIIQEILEQEVADYLARGYYERGERRRLGYRNGYERKRLKTAEGIMEIQTPQLRATKGPYRSGILEKL